jgi:hypothetical protein
MQEISGARFIVAALNLVLQVGRYIEEHERLFGKSDYGLPPPLTPDKLKEINCTFKEWLQSKELYALNPFFIYSQAAQGYGSLEVVPALYGLWWNDPGYIGKAVPVSDLTLRAANIIVNGVAGGTLPMWLLRILGFLVDKLLPVLSKSRPRATPAQAVLKTGFSKLWENIVETEKLDVRLGCPVKMIDRSGDMPVVTFTDTATNTEKTITDAAFVVVRFVCVLQSLYEAPHALHASWSQGASVWPLQCPRAPIAQLATALIKGRAAHGTMLSVTKAVACKHASRSMHILQWPFTVLYSTVSVILLDGKSRIDSLLGLVFRSYTSQKLSELCELVPRRLCLAR